jgi:hypothetical protein
MGSAGAGSKVRVLPVGGPCFWHLAIAIRATPHRAALPGTVYRYRKAGAKRMAHFKNHQWAVTDYGVESLKPAPDYHFTAQRLTEQTDRGNGPVYDWPPHMAEKTWVDTEAFIEAFTNALEIHAGKYDPPLDEAMLRASIAEARREARRR